MKVLIVDDDSDTRDRLTIALQLENNFNVIGTAVNGQEAFLKCGEEKPDLILMDLRMPVADGVKGTELIKSCYKDVRILMMTSFINDSYIKEGIDRGAEGFILKSMPTYDIVNNIKKICNFK